MGLCESSEVKEQQAVSKKIDRQLNQTTNTMMQKLLLLGPGESGKSTCLKQMQLLHSNGFPDKDKLEKKFIVYLNTIQSMLTLLDAMDNMGFVLQDETLQSQARFLRESHAKDPTAFTQEVKTAIKSLWNDGGVQKSYSLRSQIQLAESAHYFFENLDRISETEYMPTAQDILHTRVPTTGVVQVDFTIKGINFEVFDVGGQRSERRKWIHCFDDVNGIIFVVAISEYDQVLKEDNKTNRLMEALDLYDGICNSSFFDKSSMILFLNKKDLFEEKIQTTSLKCVFPNYQGGLNYDDGVRCIRKEFNKLNRQDRKVYIHETCATDTTQVHVVINSVIDTIVQDNLKDTGMI